MKKPHRRAICASSIAAFLAVTPASPGVLYDVLLGDSAVVGSVLSGATGLSKTGGGTLVLSNTANSYTGATTISNGSIVITDPAQLGLDASPIFVTGGRNVRGASGGSLILNGTGGAITLSRGLSLQGQGPITDRGAALISSGDNTLTGTVDTGMALPGTTTGVNTRIISASGTLRLAGTLNVFGASGTTLTTLGGLNQAGASSFNLTGALAGTGTMEKVGGGTLFLNPSTSADFSGSIRVTGGGGGSQSSVRVTSANVLGTRTAGSTAAVLDLQGGVLEVLMNAPSVLAGGSPANVYFRGSLTTIFVDKSVGGSGINGTAAFGQLAFEENLNSAFASRNGYGIGFGPATVNGGTANNTFTNSIQGGGLLRFTGDFWSNTDNTGNRLFTVGGTGDTLIDGNIVASAAEFDHSFIKTGTGTLTVTGADSTLDGSFSIIAGTVATRRVGGGILGAGLGTGALNLGSGATAGTLNYLGAAGTGAGETVTRTVALAGTTGGARINASQPVGASTPLIFDGPVTVSTGSKTLTLGGTSTLDNEIRKGIPNGATGTTSLLKTGPGTWVLSGTNGFIGNTTIANGVLKIRANATETSTVLDNTSGPVFNVDAEQNAGGTFVFSGHADGPTFEVVNTTSLLAGHGVIRVENAGHETTLATFLPRASTLGASVDFQAPTPLDMFNLSGATAGFIRGSAYFNSADFAYVDATLLRAPRYGEDSGFTTSATALAAGGHNLITGSMSVPSSLTIQSLKISGSQTLTANGQLNINSGFNENGGILIDGGNAIINGAGGISQGLGALAVGGAGLVVRVNGASDSLTLATPITSATVGGFAKNGLGTLILAAANSQTGTTNINEGTVRLAPGGRLSTTNQALAIRQAGTLDLNGVTQPTTTIGAFNGSGIVTNGSATTATFAIGNSAGVGTFSGMILDGVGRIGVLKQSSGDINLNGLNTYTGATTIASSGTIQVTNLADIGSPSGIGRGDAASDATNADSLIFTGAQTVSATTGNTFPSGLVYLGNSTVSIDRLFRLGGTGSGAGARISANSTNNAGLVFRNTAPIGYTAAGATSAQNLVLSGGSIADNRVDLRLVDSGVASGSLGVTKNANGKWVLGNATNIYTGATRIIGGSLEAFDGLSLPKTSALLFGSSATTLSGGVLESSGVFTRPLSAGTVANTVNFNANGNFPGSGGFAAAGDRLTVNLGGASGLLTWGSGGFLMPGTSAATLRLSSTAALGEVRLENAIDLGAAQRTIQVDENFNTGADFATLAGALSGAGGGITKTGAGILDLRGDSTYTGTTNVAQGTLVVRSLGHSGVPGPSSVGNSASGNTDAGAINLGNGATTTGILDYVGSGETSDRRIRLNVASGTTQIHADGTGPLILTNVVNSPGTAVQTLALRGTNAGGNRIDSVLTNSPSATAFSVTVDGSATWILTAANLYTGNTTSNAGALGIGNDAALGVGTLSLANGSLFAYGGDRVVANPVTHGNNVPQAFIGDHSLTFTAGLNSLASTGGFGTNNFIAAGNALTFKGIVANQLTGNRNWNLDGTGETIVDGDFTTTTSFGVNIAKTGTGTLELRGTGSNFNRNNAPIDLDSGVLRLGANEVIPHGPGFGGLTLSPETGETATFDLNGKTETITALLGTSAGSKTIDNTSASAASLTFGASDGAVNFNGEIRNSGGGPLSIAASGTVAAVLSGSMLTYTGGTTVQAGASLTFSNAAPQGTSGLTVAGNATLSLINGSGTPIAGLSTLNLGAGGGTSVLGLDVGATSDTLTTSGAAITTGNVNFMISAGAGFGAGSYDLLVSAAGGFAGTNFALSGIPGGFTYALDQSDLNRVRLVATPAPAGRMHQWTGDLSASWAAFSGGNTNWEVNGIDPATTPGATDIVIFNSVQNPPTTTGADIVATSLDGNRTVDSIRFNGSVATGTAAPTVHIAPGLGGVLTIKPASASDGISIADGKGAASIVAPIELGSDQTWTVGSLGNPNPALTVSGPMSGTGNLIKEGSGAVALTGVSTRQSATTINAGALIINSEAALGANPATLSPGHLTFDGGTLRSSAPLTIDDGSRGIRLGVDGGTFDTAGGSITIAAGMVISGPGNLTKRSPNLLILNGANTFAGTTTILGATIRVANDAALSTGSVTLGSSGTVLELAGGITSSNPITVSDNGNEKGIRLLAGANSATHTGDITVEETTVGNVRPQASAGGTLILAGRILQSGTAAPGLRVNDAVPNTGTVVLSGANTYAGPTEVRQGILRNGASEVIPGALIVNAFIANPPANLNATYDLDGHDEIVLSLTYGSPLSTNAPAFNLVTTGAGTLTLGGDLTTFAGHARSRAELRGKVVLDATRTFNVADASAQGVDLLVAGEHSGAGGLRKTGPGTLTMQGTATYSGATTVEAGTLLVEGSISGAVVVAGGTLGGIGSVGAIQSTSGAVSPGESIGTLTAASLSMQGTASFQLEINTTTATTDLLTTTGPLVLSLTGSALNVTDLGGNVSLAAGTRFTFITYNGPQSGSFVVDGFAIADDIDTFRAGANRFAIDYNDRGGTAVSLIVVPEPTTAASLLGGFGFLAGLTRRGRKKQRP